MHHIAEGHVWGGKSARKSFLSLGESLELALNLAKLRTRYTPLPWSGTGYP